MSLNSIMQIGGSALSAYQTAIAITSENISNVNTPGYSRQAAVLETAPSTTSNVFSLGTGVNVTSVSRAYDALLQQQLVNAQTTQGYDTTKSNVLQQIQPSFNEVANNGLGAAISSFFGAWQSLASNPAGTTERQTVQNDAQILADNFHSVSQTLTDTIATQNTSLPSLTGSINATLTNIAQLNGQIKTSNAVGGNANELKDQRDQLIRNLSQQVGITYKENSDGTTDVSYADTSGTYALVTGSTAGSFSLTTTGSSAPLYNVQVTPAGGGATTQVAPTSGVLGATLALRDTIIPGYQSQLDSLASTIATKVNSLQTTGSGLNSATVVPLFTGTTGATIAVNPALTSTDQIAAAASGAASGDNTNALAIADLQNDTTTMSGTTFNGYYDSLVSTVGLDVQSSQTTVTQDTAFTQQLTTLQQSNSGVSLDEELTNLMQYQRSYQAASKVITTATNMMDTVLGLIQ